MPSDTVSERKKKRKGVIEFLSEKGPMKKVKGGKRTVDAVTGPPHKKVKPKIHKHPPTVRLGIKAIKAVQKAFKKRDK